MSDLLHQHFHVLHLRFTEMSDVYAAHTLRRLAKGLVGIFVPIYLWVLGFGISGIALFFVVAAISRLLLQPISVQAIAKYGPKHMMVLALVGDVVNVLLLAALSYNSALWWAAAIALGFETAFFWMGNHADFSVVRNKNSTNKQMGILIIAVSAAASLGPFIGGLIATRATIQISFMIAIFLLIVALFPLLRTQEAYKIREFSWSRVKESIIPSNLIANFSYGFEVQVATYLWPLFIFIFLGTYEGVGAIASISLIITAFVAYSVGKAGDKGQGKHLLKGGAVLYGAIHSIRGVAQSFGTILGVNTLGDIANLLIKIPFVSRYYRNADSKNRLEYIFTMETAATLGHLLVWSLVFLLAQWLEVKTLLVTMFIAAGFASLWIPLIHRTPAKA